MLSLSFNASPLFFNAEAAYKTRPFAAAKRHLASDIQAASVELGAPDRREVEQFIHDVFAHTYGADIQHFMPQLISLRGENNQLVAAFGMRKADVEPLFLERYLDAPIETVMSNHFNRAITRQQITEIGNLAVSNPRNAGVLIAHVIQYSLDNNVEWCVATAHHRLQNGLIKGGRDVYALQSADKSRLTATEQSAWGRYYDNSPQVVAVRGIAQL
ncbi:thermostable hemolysin [Methylotenera sp.]|uniref:thermostable hemolysin n=1 Tax=Methylotenera sp. TaxID=2051956 RepID=UPI002EDA3ECB